MTSSGIYTSSFLQIWLLDYCDYDYRMSLLQMQNTNLLRKQSHSNLLHKQSHSCYALQENHEIENN